MKSPTSFFNGSVLRKDLTRFAPVWVLYSVCWVLAVSVFFHAQDSDYYQALEWMNTTHPLAVFNLLYAGLSAFLLFGDLFKSRMCNALHAMPMRHEGWLLTHSAGGVLFALIPYGIATILLATQIPGQLGVVGLWFAVAMLQYLFFFGLAVFSAMCGGNILGMGAVYFILNFFFLLVYGLFQFLYLPLLHGLEADVLYEEALIPVSSLANTQYINLEIHGDIPYFQCEGSAWLYLGLCVLFGLVFWGLSLLLYRRRKLECAGDFIAFRPVGPVFLIFYTLGVGIVLYLMGYGETNVISYLFLAVGIIVGFFTGKMLLEKQLKVFKPKAFVQLLVLSALLAGSLVVTRLDPAGITYYVPQTEDVAGMRIYDQSDMYVYQSDPVAKYAMATDPQQIRQLQEMHRQMTLDREMNTENPYCTTRVVYYLKDGSTCAREYYVDVESTLGQQLKLHLSDYQQVFFTNDWDAYVSSVKGAWLKSEYKYTTDGEESTIPDAYSFSDEELAGLMQALKADCDAGNMVQSWVYRQHSENGIEYWLQIETDTALETRDTAYKATGTRTREVYITPQCVNTMIYLNSLWK